MVIHISHLSISLIRHSSFSPYKGRRRGIHDYKDLVGADVLTTSCTNEVPWELKGLPLYEIPKESEPLKGTVP